MLATDQPIRFLARGLNSAGDSIGAAVAWRTTGGTILPDGRFSAGAVGTFMVMGSHRQGGELQVDTATVVVVRRQLHLAEVEVRPGSISMAPGDSQNFSAIGRTIADRVVPIGVRWHATGGTIDFGGTYVAGQTEGTYHVVAANMGGTVTDTARVVIQAAVVAPPPVDSPPVDSIPAAPAPPTPVLGSVTVVPSVVTLAPRTTKQFKAYGRTTNGDSVAVSVVFQATGGTVSSAGLYTAGSTAGKFRVIASDGVLADTSSITVSSPLGSNTGIPFGSYECKGSSLTPFTMCIRAAGDWSAAEMSGLKAGKGKLILNQGGYAKFKTNGFYDPARYHAWVQSLKPYVESWKPYLADGTLMGAQVIDDRGPNNWGGRGITNQQVDEMAKWWKELVPGISTFVAGGYADDLAITGYTFRYLDGSISQYNARYMGDVAVWRDKALAAARTAKTSIILSLNVLAGGKLVSGCYKYTSGDPAVAGTCAMTPTEIRTYGAALANGDGACGLASWKTTAEYQALPGVTDALKYVAELASKRPAVNCLVR